jgi:hypothetical protein
VAEADLFEHPRAGIIEHLRQLVRRLSINAGAGFITGSGGVIFVINHAVRVGQDFLHKSLMLRRSELFEFRIFLNAVITRAFDPGLFAS